MKVGWPSYWLTPYHCMIDFKNKVGFWQQTC